MKHYIVIMEGDYPCDIKKVDRNIKLSFQDIIQKFRNEKKIDKDKYVTIESEEGYEAGDDPMYIICKKKYGQICILYKKENIRYFLRMVAE